MLCKRHDPPDKMFTLATISGVCCFLLIAAAQSTPSNEDYDVIIVGAGLTGLTAAREIRKAIPGARVGLLEARDQVGGRVRAASMSTAQGEAWLDTGSHFISPTATALSSLASEFGIPLFTQTNCGIRTLDIRTKRQAESESFTTRRSFGDALNSTELSSWATRNVHDYLLNSGQTKPTMDTANRLLQTLFDSPDKSVSVLHLILAAASENATVADLLSRYGHGQALLMQGDSVVTVKTPNRVYQARQVVVTVPPVVASSIQFSPPLQPEYAQFIESYRPTGRAHYFTITFESPFWRGRGKNGQIIHTNPQGPVVWLTAFDVGEPTMCAGVGATGVLWGIAHVSEDLAPAPRRAAYLDIVTRALGGNGLQPEEYFSEDPTSRGSIAVLPPNVDIELLRYLQGVNDHGERILFASAEYSNVSMGLMNGAVLSGKAAGEMAARRLRSNDETTGESAGVDTATEGTSFVYHTSTLNPPAEPMETSTFKHFSFGNAEQAPLFVQPPRSGPPPATASLPTTTTTARSTFTPSNRNRSTTPFQYHTSTINTPVEAVEAAPFVHFSNGNVDAAPSNDTVSSSPNQDIAKRLKEILDEAPTSNSLQLARQLSEILHNLLLSMPEERQ
ncbi:amine oxidase [Teladorsagia circumcincta]|uniref:monoamine oxidase n=1 Tax=Teladorsagia circumcincta TaxID=45464 RepID=A0A2G9UNL2_TELCI|nr:amine oxidase [Teladorsagia circumcincta]